MSKRSVVARQHYSSSQGQILLGRALFCVECEIIFTGGPRCPRCASGETVWPLSEWFHSVRTVTATSPASGSSLDAIAPARRLQKQSAA